MMISSPEQTQCLNDSSAGHLYPDHYALVTIPWSLCPGHYALVTMPWSHDDDLWCHLPRVVMVLCYTSQSLYSAYHYTYHHCACPTYGPQCYFLFLQLNKVEQSGVAL